jgi:flagellar biosynthesis/type III secretory pathway protein FliH
MTLPWLVQKEAQIKPFGERVPKRPTEPKEHWLLRLPKVQEQAPTKAEEHPKENELKAPEESAKLGEMLALLEKERASLQSELAATARSIGRLAEEKQKSARPASEQVVSLAILIAQEILESELRHNPAPLLSLVHDAIQQLPVEKLCVRANKTTIELLLHTEPSLKDKDLVFLPDQSLQNFDLIVDASNQAIAYQPGQQLESLRTKLQALFAEAQ